MKTPLKLRATLGLVAILAALLAAPEASARPPRAREAGVVVQSIDRSNKMLTLKYPQGRGPEQVIWTKQTKFIHNDEFAPASDLKAKAGPRGGKRARKDYRLPAEGEMREPDTSFDAEAGQHEAWRHEHKNFDRTKDGQTFVTCRERVRISERRSERTKLFPTNRTLLHR